MSVSSMKTAAGFCLYVVAPVLILFDILLVAVALVYVPAVKVLEKVCCCAS